MAVLPNEIPTLINGSVYNWANIRFQFSNMTSPIIGVKAINYTPSRERENIYGVGDKPIARSSGNVTFEASISLLKDEVKRLQDASPFGDITLLGQFDIIVSYRDSIISKITNETIKGAEFTSNPTSISQNDKEIVVELPLIIAGIQYGTASFL